MQSLPNSGRFNDFMSRIGDLAMLNVIWLICCIPIVTIGASTAALYEVIRSIREGYDTHILRRFISVFPRNFGKNLLLTVIYITLIALTSFDLWYLSKYMSDTYIGPIGYGAVLAIVVALLAGANFIFPVASRSKLSVRSQITQSFGVSMHHIGTTLLALALIALPIAIAVFVPGGLPFVVFFWGLLFSSTSAWLIITLMLRVGIISDVTSTPSPTSSNV